MFHSIWIQNTKWAYILSISGSTYIFKDIHEDIENASKAKEALDGAEWMRNFNALPCFLRQGKKYLDNFKLALKNVEETPSSSMGEWTN